jgi:hypothetical protein
MSMFRYLFDMLSWLFYPFMIIVFIVGYFFISVTVWSVIKGKGKKKQPGQYKRLKKPSKLKRLLIDFPRQYSIDMINRQPDFFKYQGLIIYEGRQGSGKTSTMIHDTLQIKKEFPRCKTITNLAMLGQDDELKHWKQLVHYKNGIYGVIAVMDELQNWFSCNQSKDFPPEMLSVITQNRKNRRVIFGTAQSFHLLAKSIRSQCIEVRKCNTFFGCLTFVHRKEPILDSEGNVAEWKNRGWYFYVHNQELREAYDTWKVIESYAKSGFKEGSNVTEIANYTNVVVKKK